MCNAITTNLTSFFREPHHFEHLRDQVLPAIVNARVSGDADLVRRLLHRRGALFDCHDRARGSAGVLEWDVRILATDLDSDVLATAATASIAPDRVKGLSAARQRRFFTEQKERGPAFQSYGPKYAAS